MSSDDFWNQNQQNQPPGQGQYAQGQYGQGQVGQGEYAQGQYGQGQVGQGQYGPQGQNPQGQYGQGQYAQGQLGQGQYGLQGQYPQGQSPQGQYGYQATPTPFGQQGFGPPGPGNQRMWSPTRPAGQSGIGRALLSFFVGPGLFGRRGGNRYFWYIRIAFWLILIGICLYVGFTTHHWVTTCTGDCGD